MQLTHIQYKLQKHLFTNKSYWCNSIIDVPNEVFAADSRNIFKSRLDKCRYYQDLKIDWKAEITGIGSRSLKFST